MINMVDEFVVYDDAQYTKRDWRNRNLIKTKIGLKWLTIPVDVKNKYRQAIKETKVIDSKWISRHIKTLNHNYSKAMCYDEMSEWINKVYGECENKKFLSDINLHLIHEITGFLGIRTKISTSSDYILEGDASSKLLNICLQTGASGYLSGPAAKSYLDLTAFEKAGIKVKWMDYTGYSEYPQIYPPFVDEVSILDLFLNMGKDSYKFLKSARAFSERKSLTELQLKW